MAIQLLVTDEGLAVQGDPLADWTALDATLRFNEPGSGSVDLVAHPYVMAQLQPGHRLVVIRDGEIWMAGPMEITQDYSWGIGSEGEAPPGKVRVNFSDDLALAAGHITWADPAVTWANQPDTASYSITSTNAETIIRTLVNVNCGPGALAARQIANLALAPVAGVGTTTSVNTRFEGLLAACRRVAIDGGGLGFRTRQTSSQIEFEVYAPVDRTATARFAEGLGNLRAVTYKQSAPTVTHALVQGSEVEAPADRKFVEVADAVAASAWWRVEQLVSGTAETDTNGELTQDGNEALAGGAAPVELATVTVDTEDLKAGRDYTLGDRVTVALPTGLEVADLVRSIHLQATPTSGEYVTSLVGSPEATSDPQMVRLVRELGRRLGRLEAR
ncbi:siphovirus ReqiPepy6 Gp37-like family protein [Streptomyces sp. Z423-1]|uniref:siphovirus ReqiPepy6 Gp37-like family protein n=1 Tax=unclassified Streptomyces TaxID=2593676 RepID=UPI0014882C11|nr:siphovirus ReqiPepy6 Gp37-like family protein [Streptomyces sp. Z423-1]